MANRITIPLTASQALGNDVTFLFGVDDDFEWVEGSDGKRRPGARTGTRYTVAMLQSQCTPLVVRTPEAAPAIDADTVAAACMSGQLIRVRFEGFSAEAYQGRDGIAIRATADKAIIIAVSAQKP